MTINHSTYRNYTCIYFKTIPTAYIIWTSAVVDVTGNKLFKNYIFEI